MGLFNRGNEESSHRGIEGTALIKESEPLRTGADKRMEPARGDYTMDNLQQIGIGKREYVFKLEVRIPDREPYEVEGKFKVPAKAETTGLTSRRFLLPGLSLPVRVELRDPARVEIDWARFLASPDRKATVKEAAEAQRHELTREQIEADPGLNQKAKSAGSVAAQSWAAAVAAGNRSREDFERDLTQAVKQGWMDQADAQAARESLDG